MFRLISVKKLFVFLLAAIIVMLGLLLFHGSFLTEDVEAAIVQAGLERAETGMLQGECAAEGHHIFKTETKGDTLTVYGAFSVGNYGFLNENFVEVSGTGSIPAKLTFEKAEDGTLTLTAWEEPQDGSLYRESLKKLFPLTVRPLTLISDYYNDLKEQKEACAQQYLQELGREAAIGDYGDFSYTLATDEGMSVEVSNALFGQMENYPIYLGTEERLEDGTRYVYESRWESDGAGNGTMTFEKRSFDTGEVVESTAFDVKGDTFTQLADE